MKPSKPPLSREERAEIWKSFWLHALAATGFIIITSIAVMIVQAGAGESLSLLIYLIQGVLNFLVWARFVKRIEKYKDSTAIPYPSTYYAIAIGSFIIFVGPLLMFLLLLIRMLKVPTLADPKQDNADKGIKPPIPSAHPGAVKSTTPRQTNKLPKAEQFVVSKQQVVASESPKTIIMKPEPEPKPSALPFIDDELFYEEVAKEIDSDARKPGLWTKAFVEADGDNEKAKVIYIRLRVAQLMSAKEAELKEQQRLENERIRAEEEAAKMEAARAKVARKEAARMEAEGLEAAELERQKQEAEAEEARKEEERQEAIITEQERERIQLLLGRFSQILYEDTDHISRDDFRGSKSSLLHPVSASVASSASGLMEFQVIDLIKRGLIKGVYVYDKWYLELNITKS